jgi:hypothetical protein
MAQTRNRLKKLKVFVGKTRKIVKPNENPQYDAKKKYEKLKEM